MTLTDIINKGSLKMEKQDNLYFVEYSDYNEYGILKTMKFSAKTLRLAYLKLEEYLKFKN